MSSRKPDVGAIVYCLRASDPDREHAAKYRVEELLQLDSDSVLYRIKCDAEPFDRIVAEHDLICA